MSSTVGDPYSPPAHDHRPTVSLHDENEESSNPDNKNVLEGHNNSSAFQNPSTLPETDLVRLENEKVYDRTSGGKSKEDIQISPNNRCRIGENQYEMSYSLPPDLSILNVNGRPRFELLTVRENGRLRMFMVPKRWPQLVRSPPGDGRLKMWLLNDDQHGGEQPSVPPVRRSI